MNFAKRVLSSYIWAEIPYKPYKPYKPEWQNKVGVDRAGKPRAFPHTKEGTFTGDPESIARDLKNNSTDFKQAMSRLNFYQNSAGDKLGPSDRARMTRAKQALYRAYGREMPDPNSKKPK